jgi:hypothetical protein
MNTQQQRLPFLPIFMICVLVFEKETQPLVPLAQELHRKTIRETFSPEHACGRAPSQKEEVLKSSNRKPISETDCRQL